MALILQLDADTKKATSKIKAASKSAAADVKKLEVKTVSAASKMKTAMSGFGTVLAGLGFAFVLRGIKNIISETITFRDEIAKFSKASGISVEFLSAMGFAAERSGASMKSLTTGFGRLARNISDAARGLSTPKEAFDALGISTVNADGSLKNLETLLPIIADKFRGMSDETRKAALAQELFGRGGLELIPLLNEGSEGIRSLMEEAKELGIVFGEQAAVEAEAAADAILNFNTATTAMGQNLAANILPPLTRFANTMADVVVAAQDSNTPLGSFVQWLQDEGAAFSKLNPLVGAYLDFINQVPEAVRSGNEATEEFLETIGMVDAKFALPEAPPVPFVGIDPVIFEDILPPMEEIIAGLGEAKTLSQQWAENQAALAETIPDLPENIKIVNKEMEAAAAAAGTFSQNLARALISGQGLEKALLGAAINLGLSLIPGGSLFGGFFAHGGVAPGGGIPSIVGEGGGAPEIIQSATPIRVTPLTTNNNTLNRIIIENITINNQGGTLDPEDVQIALNEAIELGLPVRLNT